MTKSIHKINEQYDVIIIGAGASGMMCAIEAGKRGRRVWLIDHAKKIGEKIRIAGGGRCNFTNLYSEPQAFLSANPHFCKSALSRYTQYDFIEMVKRHNIAYHEKDNGVKYGLERKLGQLFCDKSAQQIIDMLLQECHDANVQLDSDTSVNEIEQTAERQFHVKTDKGDADCQSLVIATGGLSIPKIGASSFGYDIAKKFGLKIIATDPALVPLTFENDILEWCKNLSGIAVDAEVRCGNAHFREGLLFTHRGLSGPSILQISSYWKHGESIIVNFLPEKNMEELLISAREKDPKTDIVKIISHYLPNRLAQTLCARENVAGRIAEIKNIDLKKIARAINAWEITPQGTEGYKIAEVTIGGVATDELSSKTMEAKKVTGLYFIGEVVDVTGHLGGYNFQWAWSSGWAAGQDV